MNVGVDICGEPEPYQHPDPALKRDGWLVANGIVGPGAFPPIDSTVNVGEGRFRVVGVRWLMTDEVPEDCHPQHRDAVVELLLRPERLGSR